MPSRCIGGIATAGGAIAITTTADGITADIATITGGIIAGITAITGDVGYAQSRAKTSL